jgi:acyl-[acyl-carrier-protein]-phospholipid O-acyltransferase/long-chain-fatty-acid--[acyl-carrier-protein] ligase
VPPTIFAFPFLILAGYAGQIADRFSKTRVLQVTKAFEILFMLAVVGAMVAGVGGLATPALLLLATQTSLLSPAKFGIVPEMIADAQIVRANGLLGLTTCAAIVIGTMFYTDWKREPLHMGLILLGSAIAGSIVSLKIRKMPAAQPAERFHWNPFHEVTEGLRRLRAEKHLALSVCGLAWLWFAGVLFEKAALSAGHSATLLAAGVGLGSLAAGALSGNYIELALVPVGSFLMGLFSVELAITTNHDASILCLFLVGCGAGLYAVPLYAVLQKRASAAEKGRILATNNFVDAVAMIVASGVLSLLPDQRGIVLVLGAVMLLGSCFIVQRMPECVVRFILWCAASLLFRIRMDGDQNIPRTGSALLVSNHVSYADAVLVGCLTRRRTIHFMIWKPIFDVPVANYFFRTLQAIPIDAASPKSTVRALRAARAQLADGELVGIFPEGEISRTGEIRSFERGFEKILQNSGVPVIPIRIDGLYGHPFSCRGGAPFHSWQKLWRPIVTVRAGAPIRDPISPVELREAVVRL